MSHILTLNGGSSSIKFALFEANANLKRLFSGKIAHIGSSGTKIELTDHRSGQSEQQAIAAGDSASAIRPLLQFLEQRLSLDQIAAVAHRLVHGGARYHESTTITPDMLAELERISPYDPEHLPAEIAMIRAVAADHPNLRQIACFDTDFHWQMPHTAQILPIPRRYFEKGVRRYGFHGISYAFLMDELKRLRGETVAHSRVILAHLGSGASMAAVLNGKSIDTTMAFSPTAGLVMSSRTGDLDPGVAVFLARTEQLSPDQFYHMANAESGLLGVSETSADMHDLLKREKDDPRAADAVGLFCYTAKKFIGAYAAVLGGLDTLAFAGGIGENSAVIRARICQGLGFLSVELDLARNDTNTGLISSDQSRVRVYVIKTDEELQMARFVWRLLE